MKAVLVHASGGPEVLGLEDTLLPDPGPGEVRIRVAAAGVNFIDVYHRTGLYRREAPFTPGKEAAGIVEAVGSGVAGIQEGDRVATAMATSTYAEAMVVGADQCVRVPEDVDLTLAAAVMLQGMTAHYLTHSTWPVEPGNTVLVHAAAGGVGQLLVQLATLRGGRVIGTCSTREKAEVARAAGAEEVILYTEQDFHSETLRITEGKGVDVVYDSVGKDTFDRSMRSLRPRGMLVLYGQSSGVVPPVDPAALKNAGSVFLTRPILGHYVARRDELEWRASDLFRWIAAGTLHVHVDRTFPLAEAAEAHRYLEARKSKGKVLLVP